MELGFSQKRALMSAPVLLAAASCVPSTGLELGAAAPLVAASLTISAQPTETPAWAKLEPGEPYRIFVDAVAPAKPFAASDEEGRGLDCLSKAIYYEARSETEDGQRAVAQVVLNRVRHPTYPNSICGVVYQGSQLRTGCQFTFTCDGSLRYGAFGPSWERARRIAAEALAGQVYAPVGTATHYHTTAILPYWASSLTRLAVVGAHVFYRWRGAQGRPAAFTQAYAGIEPGLAQPPTDAFAPVITAAVAEVAPEVEMGVRRWRSAAPGVRIHRGSAAVPAEAPAIETAAVEAEAPGEASFGVRVHRSAGEPTS